MLISFSKSEKLAVMLRGLDVAEITVTGMFLKVGALPSGYIIHPLFQTCSAFKSELLSALGGAQVSSFSFMFIFLNELLLLVFLL